MTVLLVVRAIQRGKVAYIETYVMGESSDRILHARSA